MARSEGTIRATHRVVGLVAPLALAAALAGAAVVTVAQAGCEAPGHLVTTGQGLGYVPGCLAPLDLPTGGRGVDADARRG